MEISKIGAGKCTPGIATNKEVASTSTAVNSNKGSDRKKLIAAALGGLAAAGVAALAIYKHKKVPSELGIEEFKKIGKFDKGFAEVKGKPFSGKITVPGKDGKTVMEYAKGQITSSTHFRNVNSDAGTADIISEIPVFKKVYSQNDGAKIVEKYRYGNGGFDAKPWRKTVFSKNGITSEYDNDLFGKLHSEVKKQPDGSLLSTREIGKSSNVSPGKAWRKTTINTKTGEVLDSKLAPYPNAGGFKSKPLVRQTKNGVTTKNGKIHATRTQKFDENGNKIIKVNYGKNGEYGFREITITPEGKRTELDEASKMFRRRAFDQI